jgi:hypothetical protein
MVPEVKLELWKVILQMAIGVFTAGAIWVGNVAWETRATIYRTYDAVQVLIIRTEERYAQNERTD